MLHDCYLNHHHHPLLSSPYPSKEEVELVTPLPDFDPVEEWLLDLDSPPPPSLIMMSSSLEPPPPLDDDVVVVGSPIDAKMEKVTLVEEEEERNCRLIENNKEEEEEEEGVGGGGGGGEDRNGGLPGGEEKNDDDSTTVEKVKGDLTGEEKNDSNMEEENEKDDDDEEEEGSSDESSSSSSSSTSSSEEAEAEAEDDDDDDDDDDDEEGEIKGSETEETFFISDEDDEEEEEGGPPVQKGPIRSKHELEDLPPVRSVEVSLEPHQQTIPLGVISSIFGSRVIIEGSEKHSALNEGSILWITESRSPLGIVDEIFGPVNSPYYVIRYNSDEEVPTGINVGSAVSFVPEFAESVLNNKDLHKKGYDASGDNDEELSDEEFSDDEKEAEHRKSLRQLKRATHVNHDSGFGKRTGFKSARFQKDKRPPISTPPLAASVSQQPRSQPHQLQNQVTNIRQSTCNFSQRSANPGASVGPSTTMMQTFPPQPQGGVGTGFFDPSQQMNPVWANSFQPQPHPMNMQGGGFPMNPLPPQQFGEYANSLQYQIQFNQALNSLAGGMMPYLQQQFVPNLGAPLGNMPWFGGQVNPPLAGQPSPPVGAMGHGGLGQQASFECRNVNPQGNLGTPLPADGQGEMRPPPMHSNRGRPFPGRRPYQRGRHSYGGRGQQRNG